jgi:regulatory protein
MKKTITDIKKMKSGYKVTFDDEFISNIELDIFIKYHLKPGISLEKEVYYEMLKENDKIFYTKLGVLKLKRMQTKKELLDYLIDKGCNYHLAQELVSGFEKRRYINDDEYTRLYIEMKKHLYGPKLISSKLLKKGVDQELIKKHLRQIDEYEILTVLVKKKYISYKQKTQKQALISTRNHLIGKGYKREIIDSILMHMKQEFPRDEKQLLEKTFDKLYIKYKEKKEGYELKAFIKQKLYQKGFEMNDIEAILLQKDVLS